VDKLGKSALHYAVTSQNYLVVETLLRNKANANLKDKNDDTALHILAEKFSGRYETARVLLGYEADVNIKNKLGHTPISLAMKEGKWLLALKMIKESSGIPQLNNLFETTFHETKLSVTPLIYFIASDVDDSLLKAPA
jgi:hypothetical protein